MAIKAITSNRQVMLLLNSLETIIKTRPFKRSSRGVKTRLFIPQSVNKKEIKPSKEIKTLIGSSGIDKVIKHFLDKEQIRNRYTYRFITSPLRGVKNVSKPMLDKIDGLSRVTIKNARQIFKQELKPNFEKEMWEIVEPLAEGTTVNVEVNCEPVAKEPDSQSKHRIGDNLIVGETTAFYSIKHLENHMAEYKAMQKTVDSLKDDEWITGLTNLRLIDKVNVEVATKVPATVSRRELTRRMRIHFPPIENRADKINVDYVIQEMRVKLEKMGISTRKKASDPIADLTHLPDREAGSSDTTPLWWSDGN